MNSIDKQFEELMNSVALESEGLIGEDIAIEGVIDNIKAKARDYNANKGVKYPEATEILTKKIRANKRTIYTSDKELAKEADIHIAEMKKIFEKDLFKTKIYVVAGVKVLFIVNKLNPGLFIMAWYPTKTITNKTDLMIVNFKSSKKADKPATESEKCDDCDDDDLDDLDEDDIAEEKLGKVKSSQDILKVYEKKISHLKSAEICDAYSKLLKEEATKFNSALAEMAKINKEFSTGKITKDQVKEKVKPYAELLKKQCEILNIKKFDVKITAVTADDLKKVKEVISGMLKLVSARKAELTGSSKPDKAKSDKANESVTTDDIDAEFKSLFIDMDCESDK